MFSVETQSTWTDERVDTLKKLHADKLSASQIGDQLGVTRNAVIGKLSRLGLLGKRRGRAPHAPNNSPRSTARSRGTRPKGGYVPRKTVAPHFIVDPSPTLVCVEAPDMRKLQLHELGEEDCRFPIGQPGNPDFAFCGVPDANFPIQPYCSFHSSICGAGYGNNRPRGDNRRSATK